MLPEICRDLHEQAFRFCSSTGVDGILGDAMKEAAGLYSSAALYDCMTKPHDFDSDQGSDVQRLSGEGNDGCPVANPVAPGHFCSTPTESDARSVAFKAVA